ncbi:hypothetical protein GCM10025859_13910 [Alicyclobacillus fastidiosus]|nr:M24 family metallopeptidase [Alicyclobacillus fastidiosus]GMA60951.1 hypothetical protein GCM10025859_13910 [Alicyclobacillus fastidiosus]
MKDYLENRVQRMQGILGDLGVDAVVATSSANFFYFTETWINPHERLLAYVIRKDGDPVILAPKMHREDLANAATETLFWEDGQDAISLLATCLPEHGTLSIDNLWPSQNLISLMKSSPKLNFINSVSTLGRLRLLKDERERTLLREAGKAADTVMAQIVTKIRPGMSELEVVEELNQLWKKVGAREPSFHPIVGAGANGAMPHHQSDETVIRSGNILVIDMGDHKSLLLRYDEDMCSWGSLSTSQRSI